MYSLTELIGMPITDCHGKSLGKVRELVVEPAHDPNLVQLLVFRQQGALYQVPLRLKNLSSSSIELAPGCPTPRRLQLDSAQLRLRRDVLDQQIIDVNGRKVVRVNDVELEPVPHQGHLDLRAIQVEVGVLGALRRLLQGLVPRAWLAGLSRWVRPRPIPWHMFNLIETDPARRVKLQITYDALARLHPADLADIMEELAPAEREAVFESLQNEVAADVLGEVEPRLQRKIIASLDKEKAADIVEEMEPDEAADILSGLPHEASEEILRDMEAQEREEVSDLLEFRHDSAGGLMTTDFLALPLSATVADVPGALHAFEGNLEVVNSVVLLEENGRLAGLVPLARLLLVSGLTPLAQLLVESASVAVENSREEVAELFDKYNMLTLPVVNHEGQVLGVITADDVISSLRAREH